MTTFKLRRGTYSDWALVNPILATGEQGYEIDTGRFKIGDGVSVWTGLDYFLPEPAIMAAIQVALAAAGGGGGNGTALTVHINSELPHPIYDDGPSLFLLYQNAKV